MRIFSTLAIIVAMATPALAHRDVKDREQMVKPASSVQVEKASHNTFDASGAAQKVGRKNMRERDR